MSSDASSSRTAYTVCLNARLSTPARKSASSLSDAIREARRNERASIRVGERLKPADASKLLSEQRGNAPPLQAKTRRFLQYLGEIRAFLARFRRVPMVVAEIFA